MERINNDVNNDLVFNIAQLLKEPVGATRKLELSTPLLILNQENVKAGASEPEAHDLTGEVKLTRLSKDLLAQGTVSAQLSVECSRCLDDLSLPVEGKLEERFQPSVDVETGRPMRREADEQDDESFEITANHELDLTEPVRQALLVALPLKPLCRDDCKGLCSQCGANLNFGPCDCKVEVVDNRWAALRELSVDDLPLGDSNIN